MFIKVNKNIQTRTFLHTPCSRLSWLIIYERPTAMRFLASPGGKLSRWTIGTSEPIVCRDWWGVATGWSMNAAGWVAFVSVFTIQRTAVEILSVRHPSSVFFANRFRSADWQKIQLSNFGMIATGNHNFERFAALCNTPGGSQEP